MGTLRSNEVFSNAAFGVIVVESVNLEHHETRTFRAIVGNLAPHAVIVCEPDAIKAFTIAAEPADLARLRQEVPDLNAAIAAHERALSVAGEGNDDAR